jgi:hypothetical protein
MPFDSTTFHGTRIIVLLAALAGCTAHAQPSPWESYRAGFLTMHGTDADADGGQWTDTSYRSGVTTYFANGPHGEQRHCRCGNRDGRPSPSAIEALAAVTGRR